MAAALANPVRRNHRLVATTNALRRLKEMGAPTDLETEEAPASRIGRRLGPDAVHQGCLLHCDPLPERELEGYESFRRVLVLDQVTDPHNVGAVLRSCAAFAVDALIVTDRHSPRETPALAKAAAGAFDIVPTLRVRNLANALEALHSAGYASLGLDAAGQTEIGDIGPIEPVALVLGAEGRGLRQKTRETCSRLVRIALPGRMPSLNVSTAAAVALYAVNRSVSSGSDDGR